MKFDYEGAKKAGYSDKEIQDYLSNQSQPGLAVQTAQKRASESNGKGWLNTILSLAGGGLGAAAGGVAGAGAGALIPGANLTGVPEAALGYGGAIAGAGAGAAAGNGAADMINDLAFGQNVNPAQSQQNTIDEAKNSAVGQAIGGPVAKVLGIMAHPIASAAGKVDQILANSSKTIDFFKYMDKVGGQGVNELAAKGVGQEAKQYFDNTLAPNLRAAAQQAVEAAPGIGSTTDILGSGMPVAIANYLKRNLSNGLKYGEQGKPSQEMAKTAVRYLKDDIQTQEPSIGKYNKAASLMYKGPETMQGLLSLLALGNAKGAKTLDFLGGLPLRGAQKLIPQNGGHLNQVLPRGLQFLLGNTGDEQQ